MAMVAMAPGMFVAHSTVPSSGSTAMSTLAPLLLPTFSPMNNIGASSISPSPITTVPSIGRLLSSRRIASTAAWSESLSLPWPRSRAADTAARSVTRTISIERTRSSTWLDWTVIDPILNFPLKKLAHPYSIFFVADQLWSPRYHLVALHRSQGLSHRILGGGVGDQYDRDRTFALFGAPRRRAAVALHDRFHRNVVLGEAFGDRRRGRRRRCRRPPPRRSPCRPRRAQPA